MRKPCSQAAGAFVVQAHGPQGAVAMTPIEAVMSMLGTLDEKERSQVRRVLSCPALRPCARLGHKYKKAGEIPKSWFSPKKDRMVCERCGQILIVE
jgi:hypothetical protein